MFIHANRIPTKFATAIGFGESDLSYDSGSYYKALFSAGLHEYNLLDGGHIIPAKAVFTENPVSMTRGGVVDVIMARCDGKKGEIVTAGMIIGELRKRTNGKKEGSIVCRFSANASPEFVKERLKGLLKEKMESIYAADYILGEEKIQIESHMVEKEFGTAIVSVYFIAYEDQLLSHYQGYPNFLNSKAPYEEAKFVLLPVFSGSGGVEKGSAAILHASRELEDYEINTDKQVIKEGIYTMEPLTSAELETAVLDAVKDKKFPVVLGGDHSVSLAAFKAMKEVHGEYTILHLDAHADLRNSFDGSPNNPFCVMRRGLEIAGNIVQVGLRSISNVEKSMIQFDKVFFASDLDQGGIWIDDVIEELGKKVYITLDVSVFDPSLIRSTHPEPEGMSYGQVHKLIKKVIQSRNVIGFDIVEFSPQPGTVSGEFSMAKLLYQTLSYISHFKKK
jgi:agmatinase